MDKKYHAVIPESMDSITTVTAIPVDVLKKQFSGSYFFEVNNPEIYKEGQCNFTIEDNNTITFTVNNEKVMKFKLLEMRSERNSFLQAFDLWEKAVVRRT